MAPPMKRMRADWDDRPRYGHDYYGGGGGGGATSWGPDHYPPPHHGNHHYGNHGNSNRFVFFLCFIFHVDFLFFSFSLSPSPFLLFVFSPFVNLSLA